jgi:mannose-1-phosphate guanylyltransferase
MPKQFVKLFDDRSFFQLTFIRNEKLCDLQIVVSNSEQYFLVLDQMNELDKRDSIYILERIGRDTAPAITLSCMSVDPEEIVLVTSSDHLIKDEDAYKEAIKKAESLANEDYLVMFGITPSHPEKVHRLENRGKIPVVMIETQMGEYTGKDDIVRIEDDFKDSC